MITKEEADRLKNPDADKVLVGSKWTWNGKYGKKREEQFLVLDEKPRCWMKTETGSSYTLREDMSGWIKDEEDLDEDTFESMFVLLCCRTLRTHG